MEKQQSPVHYYQNGEVVKYNDEFHVTVQEFSQLLQSQLCTESQQLRRRKIQKVPPRIRRSERVYDPVMVSIGPYHHGKPELRLAEEFKHLCLDRCAGGDEKKKAFFYSKILEEIGVVRDSYAEITIVEKYDDKSLALMMLLDASIIIDFIRNFLDKKGGTFLEWRRCLGAGSAPLMIRDMLLMENQIPFQVLKMMIILLTETEEEDEEAVLFIRRFFMEFLTYKTTEMEVKHADILIRTENDDPALHLLEAMWRVMAKKRKHITILSESSSDHDRSQQSGFSLREENVKSYAQRSVMDLKAKGITLRPNPELSLRDITFRPKICFNQLHLPVLYITDLTPVIWSNMIAFEVSPDGPNSLVLLSYGVFMKSLIQSPEDVKELQERGVLVNRLANLEKVVEMIKEIDTFGLYDQDVFKDVKRRIEEHCSSRAKTWIVELIYTRFRTPWTAIAFFAAMMLLCLTFLQTFFTIRPVKQRVN